VEVEEHLHLYLVGGEGTVMNYLFGHALTGKLLVVYQV